VLAGRLSLVVFAFSVVLVPAFAYTDGQFPGKGSVEDWHRANDEYNQACRSLNAGKYDEAIAKDKAALALYPYEGCYWGNMGAPGSCVHGANRC
jgi:outer membrane protein assembly factor BamD (BamD/ComL family)